MFDPYRKWLGIPEGQRPPTHYQLLGISPEERDRDVINAAVVRQSAFVRHFQVGQHAADAARILNELAAAKNCLLDVAKRAEYDARLAQAAPPAIKNSAPAARDLRPAATIAPPPPAAPPRSPAAPARSIQRSSPAARAPSTASYSPPYRHASSAPLIETGPIADLLETPDWLAPAPNDTRRSPLVNMPGWLWAVPGVAFLLVFVAAFVFVATRRRPEAMVAPASPSAISPSAISPSAVSPSALSPSGLSSARSAADPRQAGSAVRPISPPATAPAAVEPFHPAAPRVSAVAPPVQELPAARRDANKVAAATAGAVRSPRESRIKPANSAPPVVDAPDWSDGSRLSIPVPRQGTVVYARGNGPFVVVGGNVYSLSDGQVTGTASGGSGAGALHSLSADGKYFASTDRGMLDVRRCADGSSVISVQLGTSSTNIEFLAFGGAEKLIASLRNGDQRLQVWNLETTRISKDFSIDGSLREASLSDDGRYLALATLRYGIIIYDVQRSPAKGKGRISARIPIKPLRQRPWVDIDGMRFSPSGEELVALCDDGTRLMCWDKTTHLVFEELLTEIDALWSGARIYQGPAVEWHPGGRGWLLKGHAFFDREQKRVSWLLKSEFGHQGRHRFIDEDRLLVSRRRGNVQELTDVNIPWKKIDDSLAAVNDEATEAWLSPREPAAVRVQVGTLAGGVSVPQVTSDVARLFAERLAADRVKVGKDESAVFTVDYSEVYQPGQSIMSRGMAGMRNNPVVRQIPGQITCTLKISLDVKGRPASLWTTQVRAAASDVDKPDPRTALYERLSAALRPAPLPYFIPKDEHLIALPAVIQP